MFSTLFTKEAVDFLPVAKFNNMSSSFALGAFVFFHNTPSLPKFDCYFK